MVARDPYAVLGIEPGASQTVIKAAWRRLARAHHPDLAPDAASRRAATRRMVEINTAYEALRRIPGRDRATKADQRTATGTPRPGRPSPADEGRPSGPPPPPPSRPVTARLDTTDLFRPRNATTTPHGGGYRHYPRGHIPRPASPESAEPPRASMPTGPSHPTRAGRRRAAPPLARAWAVEVGFGKFHGLTLGEIAAREPTYVAWLARTINRDPDLVAAARVILADLGIETDATGGTGAERGASGDGVPAGANGATTGGVRRSDEMSGPDAAAGPDAEAGPDEPHAMAVDDATAERESTAAAS